jgi:hypothetical protein
MGCKYCTDEDGQCCFPYYGLRPHTHDLSKTGSFLDSTVIDEEAPLPDNFEIDPEDSNAGTYTHCPKCGASG